MQELASLALVGAAVSVLVQFIKNSSVGSSPNMTRLVVIALSVVGAGLYVFFKDSPFWESAVQVLLSANAVYGFLIKPFFEE